MAALILSAERSLSAAAVLAAVQAHGLDAASTRVLTQVSALPSASIGAEGSDSASVIVSHATSPAHHSAELLRELHRVLRAEGKLVLDEAGVSQDAARSSALCAALLLAGFVDAQASGGNCVLARKPAWKVGAAFSLRDRRLQTTAAPAPSGGAAAAWKVAADDGDDELMNEDELLTEEDLLRPAKAAGADDCEVGASGRKACANCTCGRAEGKVTIDAGGDANADMPASACGNCYLGDAYRCASCPYLGKPAFKPGEKVLLAVGGADL